MNAAKSFDEMHAADGTIRTHYQPYSDWLGQPDIGKRLDRQRDRAMEHPEDTHHVIL